MTVNKDIEENYKNRILDQTEFITEQGLDLNIIYLRVSTKDKGQQERDQLKGIRTPKRLPTVKMS